MHREVRRTATILCGCRVSWCERGSWPLILAAASAPEIRTRRKRMKKIGFLTLLITAMLLLTLAFPAAAAGPKTPAAAVSVAAARCGPPPPEHKPQHPP